MFTTHEVYAIILLDGHNSKTELKVNLHSTGTATECAIHWKV